MPSAVGTLGLWDPGFGVRSFRRWIRRTLHLVENWMGFILCTIKNPKTKPQVTRARSPPPPKSHFLHKKKNFFHPHVVSREETSFHRPSTGPPPGPPSAKETARTYAPQLPTGYEVESQLHPYTSLAASWHRRGRDGRVPRIWCEESQLQIRLVLLYRPSYPKKRSGTQEHKGRSAYLALFEQDRLGTVTEISSNQVSQIIHFSNACSVVCAILVYIPIHRPTSPQQKHQHHAMQAPSASNQQLNLERQQNNLF